MIDRLSSLNELTLDVLRAEIEPYKLKTKFRFQNWAKSVECYPKAVYKLETEEQIRYLIELARREGVELRAYGAGHSPSDLVCTDGYLLSLDRMNQVLHVDKQRNQMSFQAGIRLEELHAKARKEGMAVSSLGSISEQSIGGAISTATHGLGIKYSGLSGMVTQLTIITADTNVRTCTADQNSDLFYATLCGLGCTGIITRVTMQLEPDFKLKEEMFAMSFNDFVGSLETKDDEGEHGLLGSAEHVRALFFPHNDYVKISRINRTTEPDSPQPGFWERWFNQYLVATHFFQLGLFVARYLPSVLKTHEQILWQFSHNPHRRPKITPPSEKFRWTRLGEPVYAVAKSNEIFNYDCGPRQYTYEGCVPITSLENTLRELHAWFKKEENSAQGLQFHFPVEIRPVDKDQVWLSPCYQTRVVYIGIQIYKPWGFAVPHADLFERFEAILHKNGGRPHWAKAHTYSPEALSRIYPRFQDFLRLREEVDPKRLFVNHYLRRHLFGAEVGLRQFTIE